MVGRRMLGALMAMTVAATACGGGSPGRSGDPATGDAPTTGLSGRVAIDGSSTVFPIAQALAEEFSRPNPDVRVSVNLSGTGGGFEKFCRGETDLSNASRPIRDEEAQLCRNAGIDPIEFEIAIDGLTVAVNPSADFVTCLTVGQLAQIWEPGSAVSTWADVDRSWPDTELSFYTPGSDSGTFDYFTEEVNGDTGLIRDDITTSENDDTLVTGIANTDGGIGFFGYAYYVENTDKIRALEIDGGDGCVAPTQDTIETGTYSPLSRPLFVYGKAESIARPEVAAFLEYFLGAVSGIVADVGYVAAPPTTIDEAIEKFESARG